MKRHRVIQWSTGNVGKLALGAIIDHPALELVGLWVSGPNKAGQDAGTLCGRPPVGVRATSDANALLALDADCVCYTATADLRPSDAVDDICRILASGKNVVSSSVVPMVFPPAANPDLVAKLEAACAQGRTSFYTSGIDPGIANDALPLLLMSMCARVDEVRIMEIVNYDTYDQPEVLFGTMGFGKPLDHDPLILIPGVLTMAWGPIVQSLAHGLGVTLDEIRETRAKVATETAFDIPSGHVAAGTMAAMRFEIQGIVAGRPAIVVEHVTRLRDDLAPEWPQPTGSGCYRISVKGSPSLQCELTLAGEDGDHNTGGLVATALRLLNAIPAVCDAAPGLLSPHDLPLYTARHLMR